MEHIRKLPLKQRETICVDGDVVISEMMFGSTPMENRMVISQKNKNRVVIQASNSPP